MKIIREHIIVKVPSVFFDESRYKGVDGKQLFMDVTYNPGEHVRNYGIVVSVPEEMSGYPIITNPIGRPAYHDNPTFDWKTCEDIAMEIKEGDKVYFHYNCLLPDQADQKWNKLYLYSLKEGDKTYHYFKVKYELVFAVVRMEPLNAATKAWEWRLEADLKPHIHNGTDQLLYYTDLMGTDQIYRKRVIMIGSYVMVEPDMETWEDISIPTPEVVDGKVLLNPDGSQRLKPKEQWIVTKQMPGERYLVGWVRHTGTALRGDREFLKPGMYVAFQKFANTKMRFEGFTYFRMRQRHILAIDHQKQITYDRVSNA